MTFYISLSGLRAAQTDLGVISNNVANSSSTGFKKSLAQFGDIFAASPMQSGSGTAGQGVRVRGTAQQFNQGTLKTTDKTLDLALTGEGFFTVSTPPPSSQLSYTRNGAMGIDENRYVVDTLGSRAQVMPVDASGVPTSTAAADLFDLQIPTTKLDNSTVPPTDTGIELSSVGVSVTGVVSATFADGTTENLGCLAIANFPSQEGLRQQGDSHWTVTRQSGDATYGAGNSGLFGAVRSGSLENSNVDITEELVALISAQRNFQANSKAIEAASTLTQTIVNLRS